MSGSLNKGSRIYVAGHRGLVGSAILRRLHREGFTNLLTASREQLDLRDQAAVNYWFRANRPEYVFLVAGTVGGIWANSTRPAEFIYDNLMIHATVVHAAHIYKTKKLLYLGSSCIYPRACPQPMKEEYLLTGLLEATNEPYAVAKIAGIKLCQAYRKQYGCDFISAMPTNLYGPNDNFDLMSSHVLPALIRKFHLAKLASQGNWEAVRRDEALFGPIPEELLRSLGLSVSQSGSSNRQSAIGNPQPPSPNSEGQTPNAFTGRLTSDHRPPTSDVSPPTSVVIWGTGSPRREFLHVDDLADACLLLMERYSGDTHINIGAGEDRTIRELAETVRNVVYPDSPLVFDSTKPDGPPQKLLDSSRLHRLGWRHKIGLQEGISKSYQWYAEQ